MVYLGIRSAVTKMTVIRRLASGNPTNWLDDLRSNSWNEKKSKRAMEEYSLQR